jgi:hypothetical protein
MTFSERVDADINTVLQHMNRTMQEASIEMFGRVVDRTPIKTGDAISGWVLGVNNTSLDIHVNYHNPDKNTPTSWSKAKGSELGRLFREKIAPALYRTELFDTFRIKNETPYIRALEYGEYIGGKYNKWIEPYYTNRPTPYDLTSRGFSHKAPQGMVRVTIVEAPQIIKDAMKEVQ